MVAQFHCVKIIETAIFDPPFTVEAMKVFKTPMFNHPLSGYGNVEPPLARQILWNKKNS